MVIHYDPWWNQAAQNRATDRARRIGQLQCVQVYKLIAKDTIEERILKLKNNTARREILSTGCDFCVNSTPASATPVYEVDLVYHRQT